MARQVFVRPEDVRGDWLLIRGEEARHLVRVLRVGIGERLSVFDGEGGRFQGVVGEVTERGVKVRIEKRETGPGKIQSHLRITLIQAIPKQQGMELIISQCTQLGVERIVPVLTARTQVRIDPERHGHKMERWLRVAREAAKQCGRDRIPTVEEPTSLEDFLRRLEPHDLSLIATLEGPPQPLRAVLKEVNQKGRSQTMTLCLLIGPEGDFTPQEVEEARKHDFKPVSLGANVLRATTAATVACALVQYALEP